MDKNQAKKCNFISVKLHYNFCINYIISNFKGIRISAGCLGTQNITVGFALEQEGPIWFLEILKVETIL